MIPTNLRRDSTVHNQGGGATASTQTKDAYNKQCEWEASHPPPTLHMSIHPDYVKAIVKGYKMDPLFKHKWEDETSDPRMQASASTRTKKGYSSFKMPILCRDYASLDPTRWQYSMRPTNPLTKPLMQAQRSCG